MLLGTVKLAFLRLSRPQWAEQTSWKEKFQIHQGLTRRHPSLSQPGARDMGAGEFPDHGCAVLGAAAPDADLVPAPRLIITRITTTGSMIIEGHGSPEEQTSHDQGDGTCGILPGAAPPCSAKPAAVVRVVRVGVASSRKRARDV